MGLTMKKGGFFKLLSEDELRKIHYATLDVLETKGIKFSLPEAQNIFRDAGLKVDKEGVVRFPSYVVEDAIRKAPSRFTRHPLHPSYEKVNKGSDSLYFMPAARPIYLLDLDTGKRRIAHKQDVADFARLADGLNHFQFGNGGVSAQDIPPKIFHAIYLELMVKNTVKPMSAGDGFNKIITDDLIRLCSIILGGKKEISKKKTFHMAACPNSGCFYGDIVISLIEGAKVGMPVKIIPMPFAGSTHPVTLAGSLVQMNAEILSCVVLVQLVNPGSPVIYYCYPGIMDMRVANHSLGGPETALMAAAGAQLSRWYEIPNDIAVGTSDSKVPDGQAAYEKMMTALPAALAGANVMAVFGGFINFAQDMSLEQLVIDDEIAGNILRIVEGIDITEDKLAAEAIKEVPPGGNFLSHEHTLRYFREEHFSAELADRNPRSIWEKQGSRTILDRAREKAKKIAAEHYPPPLDRDTQRELEKAIKEICKREGESYTPFRQKC